jgi:hypothetical protein
MDPRRFCADRALLTEVWIQVGREHAVALTRFNRSELIKPTPTLGYSETIAQLRIEIDDAIQALDGHRKLHG